MNKKIIIPLIFLISLSSCESLKDNNLYKEISETEDNVIIGRILGAGLGALIGYQFGSGVGGALSLAGGTILGIFAGGEIAKMLDKEEYEEYGKATIDALEFQNDNETITWVSKIDKRKSIQITPLNTIQDQEKVCRDIRQVYNQNEQKNSKISTFCRDNKGNWSVI